MLKYFKSLSCMQVLVWCISVHHLPWLKSRLSQSHCIFHCHRDQWPYAPTAAPCAQGAPGQLIARSAPAAHQVSYFPGLPLRVLERKTFQHPLFMIPIVFQYRFQLQNADFCAEPWAVAGTVPLNATGCRCCWDAAVEAEVGTSNKLVSEMAIDPGKNGGKPKKNRGFLGGTSNICVWPLRVWIVEKLSDRTTCFFGVLFLCTVVDGCPGRW